jgi:hypothetical protein
MPFFEDKQKMTKMMLAFAVRVTIAPIHAPRTEKNLTLTSPQRRSLHSFGSPRNEDATPGTAGRIIITFAPGAIVATLPLGSVGFEPAL